MTNKKPTSPDIETEEPAQGIFSAVLSGMASVFNQAKLPRKRFIKQKSIVKKDAAGSSENVVQASLNTSADGPDNPVIANIVNIEIIGEQEDVEMRDNSIQNPDEDSFVSEESKLQGKDSISESIQTDLTVALLETSLTDKSGECSEHNEVIEKSHKRHSPKKKSRKKPKKEEEKTVNDGQEMLDANKTESVDKKNVTSDETQSKPRIVLTFRSEKMGHKGTNVKIVSDSEKASEKNSSSINSSRRSLRNNNKSVVSMSSVITVELDNTARGNSESDDSLKTPSPSKKGTLSKNSSNMSDSNSDDSHSPNKESHKRSFLHRSKEHGDNILANAMARKEKSVNEALTAGTTRLSRRIKPTAKVLANKELRLGFESQNNARLALVSEVISPTEDSQKSSPNSKIKRSPEKASKLSIMSPSKAQKTRKGKVLDEYEFVDEFENDDIKPDTSNITPHEINMCILGEPEDDTFEKSTKDSDSKDEDDQDSDRSKTDKLSESLSPEEAEVRRVNKLKKKHLKKLGLKEVSGKIRTKIILPDRDVVSDESTMDSTNTEAIVEHLNTRSKSLDFGSVAQPASPDTVRILETIAMFEEEDEVAKAKESSDEEYNPYQNERTVPQKKAKKRKASSSDLEDSLPIVQLSRLSEKTIKAKVRSLKKKAKKEQHCEVEFVECGDGPYDDEFEPLPLTSEGEAEDEPEVEDDVIKVEKRNKSLCLCTQHTNIYLDPSSVNEVEFCRAIDWINGRAVGCSRMADTSLPLSRPSIRAPYFLPCNMHRRRLFTHHCCSGCGAFCTQGIFYQCSEGHLFHWECGLPFVSMLMPSLLNEALNTSTQFAVKATNTNNTSIVSNHTVPTSTPVANGDTENSSIPEISPQLGGTSQKPTASDIYNASPGCPHCGLNEDTLEPLNLDCAKIYIEIKTSGDKMLLPNPRFQWVPSRMTFRQSGNEKQLKNDIILNMNTLVNEVDQEVPIIPSELLQGLQDGLNIIKERLDRSEISKGNLADRDLINAICDKDEEIGKIISALVDGADPRKNVPEADGGNMLHLAARELNLPALHVCQILGCQVNSMDSKRRTPLMVAIISYDNRIKKIEKECEFTGVGGVSKEPKADKEEREGRMEDRKSKCRRKLYNIIRYLIRAGCDPSIKGPEGVTALHLSAKNCNVEACALMLEGHLGVCRTLLNQRDAGGWTPLVWAAENNNVHVVRYLLEKGADPMIADSEKNVALHWAAVSGCSRSLEALLNAGCPVDVANIHGDTPMHVSARQDNYNCLVVLLARGAKLSAKNVNGETPLDAVQEDSNCYTVLSFNNQLGPLISALSRSEVIITSDISNGKEPNVIQCVNRVDDVREWSHFTYVTENVYPNNVLIDRQISSIEACVCVGRCGQADSECSCAGISVQSWYEPSGKLVPHFDYDNPPMIFECNDMCSCNKNICLNRSLSRGPHCVLDVFRCEIPPQDLPSVGWGVKAGTHIQRGQLVTEYTGELLRAKDAYAREDHSFLFQLDDKHALEDKDTYCIDARFYGNVSRFINHSCRPNLVPVRVFTSHRDLSFPRVAFFACRDIKSGEEITFDYGEHFWAAKSKSLKCQCHSENCRYTDRKKEPFTEPNIYDISKDGNVIDDDSNHEDIMDYDDGDVSLVKQQMDY